MEALKEKMKASFVKKRNEIGFQREYETTLLAEKPVSTWHGKIILTFNVS